MTTVDRLHREDPEQRRPARGPPPAARARVVAAELPQLVGVDGPDAADAGRLPAHRRERRPRGLGALRARPDEGLPLGNLPRRARPEAQHRLRRAQGRARLAEGAGGVPRRSAAPDRDPGRHRTGVRRAAAQPRRDRTVPLRPAQPVPGQRRGRPSPVGDGLPAARVLRPRGTRGGRGVAAPQLRLGGQPAHPRRVQRGDAGLAVVLHVHLLHRPRRQVPAGDVEGVRVRPAVAHLRVHAQGRGAPHDGGHDRHRPGRAAHRRADARARLGRGRRARRHPAERDPEVPELPLLGVARPVRLRDVDQRRELLHRRAEGPLARGAAQGRPQADRRRDHGGRAGRRRDRPDRGGRAGRAQHRPAPRVHQRLRGRRQALEQDPRRSRAVAAAQAAERRRSTARSVRSPRSRRRRTARRSPPRSGSGARATGCRPTSTRRTSAR